MESFLEELKKEITYIELLEEEIANFSLETGHVC